MACESTGLLHKSIRATQKIFIPRFLYLFSQNFDFHS